MFSESWILFPEVARHHRLVLPLPLKEYSFPGLELIEGCSHTHTAYITTFTGEGLSSYRRHIISGLPPRPLKPVVMATSRPQFGSLTR